MSGFRARPWPRFGGASHLALRNLLQDKLRLTLSVVGIALAVMLILFLLGFRAGYLEATRAYLANSPGSVVVLPPGVKNTLNGSTGQFLPAGTADTVAGKPGVASVVPVIATRLMPELHGRKESSVLIGYNPRLGGGPWDLAQGGYPEADDEIVLDRVLADRHEIGVGDTLEISGLALKVVGLSNGTASIGQAYMFARQSMVESLLLAPGATSFMLVTPEDGTKPAELVAGLQQSLPGANVMLKTQVMANDEEILASIMDQIILLMVGAAFIVGALVVGMVLYTATIERRSEYGILKAIGARGNMLYRVVITQAFIAGGFGVLVGVLFAFGMGWLVTTFVPQYDVIIQPSAIVATVGAGVVMALFGALMPARSVVALAPAEVFRR